MTKRPAAVTACVVGVLALAWAGVETWAQQDARRQALDDQLGRIFEARHYDLMVYPNRTHAIAEGPGTTVHLYRLVSRYFLDHLPPGGLAKTN